MLQLCPNGALSFGTDFTYLGRVTNGTMLNATDNCLLIFHDDHNIQWGGYIYYNVYESSAPASVESSDMFEFVEYLVWNEFSIDFDPVYVLKATWEEVQHWRGLADDVRSLMVTCMLV